jgi:hypothetical protein
MNGFEKKEPFVSNQIIYQLGLVAFVLVLCDPAKSPLQPTPVQLIGVFQLEATCAE